MRGLKAERWGRGGGGANSLPQDRNPTFTEERRVQRKRTPKVLHNLHFILVNSFNHIFGK